MAMSPATAVIGASGYLGRHMALLLERQGYRNAGYDLGGDGVVEFDVTRRESFACLDPGLSQIFFFAGLTGTAEGFQAYERFVQVNEIGLLNLLAWMVESGCRARVVFPSTRLVYRGQAGAALREEDPKETKTLYAVNKLAAEAILHAYANAYEIDYTVFRVCVPYGDMFNQGYSYGTVGFFLQRALQGEDLSLYGEGEVRRTFTHVEDLCVRMIAAAALPETSREILNLGGQDLSLREAATAIAGRFGVGLRYTKFDVNDGDIAVTALNGEFYF